MIEINRVCIKCDTPFILEPKVKSTNICIVCRRAYQRAYANKVSKVALQGKKENYPLDEYQKKKKFIGIQKKLKGMKNRSEWVQFFKDRLDNLEQNEPEILVWIYDRRDATTIEEEIVTKRKAEEDLYEDTRTTHNNEKSWFD